MTPGMPLKGMHVEATEGHAGARKHPVCMHVRLSEPCLAGIQQGKAVSLSFGDNGINVSLLARDG